MNPAASSRAPISRRALISSRAVTGAAVVVLSVALAACGGNGGLSATTATTGSATTAITGSTPTTAAAGAPSSETPVTRPATRAAFAPAASGTIASINGGTIEVQDPSAGQTTILVGAKTSIVATSMIPLADITAGACATVTGTKSSATALAARLVVMSPSRNGSCADRRNTTSTLPGGAAGRFPGGIVRGGFGRSGSGSGGFQRRLGSGTLPAGLAKLATASGKVTAVSADHLTLQGFMFSFAGFGAAARSTTTTSGSTKGSGATSVPLPAQRVVTVTLSSSTKYEKTGPGSLSSLKVGECATAFGTANDIGAVTATRMSVSPAPAGGCSSASGLGRDLGRFGNPGRFGGFGGSGRYGGGGTGSGGAPVAPAGTSA